MNFPPIFTGLFSSDSKLTQICQSVGHAFGYVWSTFVCVTNPLFRLILSIKEIGSRIFTPPTLPVSNSPKTPPHAWRDCTGDGGLDPIECDIHGFPRSPSDNKLNKPKESPRKDTPRRLNPAPSQPDSVPLKRDSAPLKIDPDHDPLDNMGAATPGATTPQADSLKSPKENHPSDEEVETSILLYATAIITPAQTLLKEIDRSDASKLQDFLEILEKLETEMESLKFYASKFEKIPKAHRSVQDTMKALEDETRATAQALCAYMKREFKPNPAIKKDGHCLFWSIDDHLKKGKKPEYYRALAANHIRQHAKEFESGVVDSASTKQGNARILQYAKGQGGKQAWLEKLEKKLGRKPNTIDRYCDCIEHSNLWGGTNEVQALSEELQMPILIFSLQKGRTWRFDMAKGLAKFKDKDPILLYYNGCSHYQNLIPAKPTKKSGKT